MARLNRNRNRTERGVSLSRGPALILGAVLLVAGLYFLYRLHSFPKLSQFPSGDAHVDGKAFLGIFGVNGWSGELTAVGGGLLLFGAAQHLLAKTMSLIVGVAFAIVAVAALVHHHSALGLFAANIWTIILWGASAVLLLINTRAPRHTGHVATVEPAIQPSQPTTAVRAQPIAAEPQDAAMAPAPDEAATSTSMPKGATTTLDQPDDSSDSDMRATDDRPAEASSGLT